MKLTIDRRTLLLASSAALIARPSFGAASHQVEMLNKDPDDSKARMVFKPNLVVIQPGDTVSFVGTDRGHNCEIIEGMIPDGAEGWKGKINDDVEVTLDVPGFYGVKCTPHVGQGMVGLVVVQGDGMMDNLEAAQGVKQRGQAKKRFQAIWEAAEAEGILSA
ncbi:MAG: pseudoazurin [Pseudomonadota bacterium]